MIYALLAQADIFGEITPPQGVAEYNDLTNVEGGIGLFIFLSRFIQLIYVVAGLWVMYNFLSAGFIYLSAEGDSKANEKVKNQLTMSVIGLLIIVLSFAFAALIGQLFFGNPSFILNPVIVGPPAAVTT